MLQPGFPPGRAGLWPPHESVGARREPPSSPAAASAVQESPGSRGASAHAFLRPHKRRVPRESGERRQFALTGLLSGLRQSRAYRAGSLGEGGRAAPGASRERWLIPAVGSGGGSRPGQPSLAGTHGRWGLGGAGRSHRQRGRDGRAATGLCLSRRGVPRLGAVPRKRHSHRWCPPEPPRGRDLARDRRCPSPGTTPATGEPPGSCTRHPGGPAGAE